MRLLRDTIHEEGTIPHDGAQVAAVNATHAKGETALHHAATIGEGAAAVAKLFEAGADMQIKNLDHATALDLGAMYERAEALRELLKAGADPFAQHVAGAYSSCLCARKFGEESLAIRDWKWDAKQGSKTPVRK